MFVSLILDWTSFQRRLMWRISLKRNNSHLHLKIPWTNLSCKLFPFQYREYEYGQLTAIYTNKKMKIYLRFLVIHVFVQSDNYDNSEQSGPPVNEEHDDDTHHGPYQGHPHVIVLKRGSPSGRLAKRCCKHCIVNECIGHEEEVWNDWRNDIQFSNGNKGSSDEKSQDVSSTRLITRPHLSRKWGQILIR